MSSNELFDAVEKRPSESRQLLDLSFRTLCIFVATVSVLILIVLLTSILYQGVPHLSWTLLSSGPEPDPSAAGIYPAMMGTLWVCGICVLITVPIGIATAILLEEYQPKKTIARYLYNIIQLNITNLAGVPSVVYGMLGMTAFVSMFHAFESNNGSPAFEVGVTYYDQFFTEGERAVLVPVDSADAPPAVLTATTEALDSQMQPVQPLVFKPEDGYPPEDQLAYAIASDSEPGRISKKAPYYLSLPLGRGVLTGALTLMLVVLPVVIISTQEALRAVPSSLRAGALGLGATHWQVIWNVTLPASLPGIMTGSILALSRAIGETAPILIIAGIVYITRAPQNLMDDFTVMPLQVYNWIQRPQTEFHALAAGAIIVLLVILLSFNALAVYIRQRLQKPLS